MLIHCLAFIAIAGLLGACASSPPPEYWPGVDWRTSTPEEQGLDSAQILNMLQDIQARNLNIHSVLIVRHGYLVSEVYFPPYQRAMKHPAFSMTKSVTSILTGKALDEGYLSSVQQSPLDFFPDIDRAEADRYLGELTLEHLLTMSAGYNTTTLPDLSNKPADFNTGEFILTYDTVLWKPGTTFFYDNGLPYLMSIILQKTTGVTLRDYAQQKLFEPLGITNFDWSTDPQGTRHRQHRPDVEAARHGEDRLSVFAARPVEWRAAGARAVGDGVHDQTHRDQRLDERGRR